MLSGTFSDIESYGILSSIGIFLTQKGVLISGDNAK